MVGLGVWSGPGQGGGTWARAMARAKAMARARARPLARARIRAWARARLVAEGQGTKERVHMFCDNCRMVLLVVQAANREKQQSLN